MSAEGFYSQRISGIAIDSVVASGVKMQITTRPQVFVGIIFRDASGAQVTPTAGTITIEHETFNSPGNWQSITGGTTVDATTAIATLSVNANVTQFRTSPSTISGNGVDSLELIVSANES